MMTIRRTFTILILLAIAFFIYRAISPTGADHLLTNMKNIPIRLGIISWEPFIDPIVLEEEDLSWSIISWHKASTGKVLVFTSTLVSGWLFPVKALTFPSPKIVATGNTLVFTSTLTSGWLFPLDALVIAEQNDTPVIVPLTTGWSLTIIQDTGAIPPVTTVTRPEQVTSTLPVTITHQTTTKKPSTSSRGVTAADISLLNNLFR